MWSFMLPCGILCVREQVPETLGSSRVPLLFVEALRCLAGVYF